MKNPYFSHPFVGNSTLSKLKSQLSVRDQREYEDAYRIGTLVDAVITQPRILNLETRQVNSYMYSADEIKVAMEMRKAYFKDPLCAEFHYKGQPSFQKPFYRFSAPFKHRNVPFTIEPGVKCLYDIFYRSVNYGSDIKSTACKTQKQFEESFDFFDYDRARFWYMNTAGVKKDLVIGISKHYPYSVFKIFVNYGDTLWMNGKQKAESLAYKYWNLQ